MQEDMDLKLQKYVKKQVSVKLVQTLYEQAVTRENRDKRDAFHKNQKYEDEMAKRKGGEAQEGPTLLGNRK